METIFLAAGFLVAILYFVSQTLAKGMGTVGEPSSKSGCSSYERIHPAWLISSTTKTAVALAHG